MLAVAGYWDTRPTEMKLVAAVTARYGAAAAATLGGPVMYPHQEPGIGLRNFAPGDIHRDLDRYSPPVQNALTADFLRATHRHRHMARGFANPVTGRRRLSARCGRRANHHLRLHASRPGRLTTL